MFEAIDADGNGTLSLEELEAARPGAMFGDGDGRRGHDWRGHGHGRMGPGGPGGERGERPMSPRDNG